MKAVFLNVSSLESISIRFTTETLLVWTITEYLRQDAIGYLILNIFFFTLEYVLTKFFSFALFIFVYAKNTKVSTNYYQQAILNVLWFISIFSQSCHTFPLHTQIIFYLKVSMKL